MPNYYDIGGSFQGFLFIKTDINGDEAYQSLLQKSDTFYGGHFGLDAHKTSTGHYIWGGQIFRSGSYYGQSVLYKLKSNLDTAYIKPIGFNDCSLLTSATELSDDNYLLAGFSSPCSSASLTQADATIIKTDTNGNVIWTKIEPHRTFSDFLYPAVFKGGFFLQAQIYNTDQQTDSIIEVRKYDVDGQLKWILPLGIPGQLNKAGVLISTHDGGGVQILATIDTSHSDPSAFNPSVIYRFDSNGHIIWQKWLEGTNVSSICETSNNALIFSQSSFGSYADTTFSYYYRGQLFCINDAGIMIWDKLYTQGVDTTSDSYLFDVTLASDGGIVATGQAVEKISHKQKAWLLKVDSNGCLNGDCPRLYTGVSHVDGQDRFIVFPNPSTTQYTIALKETPFMQDYKSITFSLYDLAGRIVFEQSLSNQVTTIQRGSLSDGLYLWHISDESRIVSNGKLIFK
jgi:hypothetical protein